MPGQSMINGKAFEYACLTALYNSLRTRGEVVIEDSQQMRTARNAFNGLSAEQHLDFMKAADAAARVVIRLEPQLKYPEGNEPLYLSIQADARGMAGDVRDVLCIRRQNQWVIGLSCKHNHHAVKHSRLSDSIDFGEEWLGIPCSKQYFSEIIPLFSELRHIRDSNRGIGLKALWADIPDKLEKYYEPVLRSFIDELGRIANGNSDVPRKLVQYLIGRNDFYKIITDDNHRTTRVEAVNISGTLNRPSGGHRSIVDIPTLHLPTRIYHMGFKPQSKNTIEVVCDEGWTIAMRIHNASSEVEPSLKFDVNLISLPGSIHAQVEPW